MNEQIKSSIDTFLNEFKNHKSVKMYLKLKKALTVDQEFLSLKEKRKELQKTLALSLNTDSYSKNKEEFLKIDEEFNNYPLYLNYLNYEEEVKMLLQEIEINLK